MEEIGIRELKQRTSEVLRRVREGEVISITYRSRVIARLVPVAETEGVRAEAFRVWADMEALAQEIGACWPAGLSAVEAVREQRREL
ncbi:MAG: antitoxin [Candidatus Tectimicrobiota bacterium]|nr:MAG: antitoxin [Candidatus Tectomicrobia bacterium]